MKKRVLIVNTILGLIVLFSILFQSFHAMSHLEEQFVAKHCSHKYNHSKTEINHAHNDFDHCFTCEFTFSSSLQIETAIIPLKFNSFYTTFVLHFVKLSCHNYVETKPNYRKSRYPESQIFKRKPPKITSIISIYVQ